MVDVVIYTAIDTRVWGDDTRLKNRGLWPPVLTDLLNRYYTNLIFIVAYTTEKQSTFYIEWLMHKTHSYEDEMPQENTSELNDIATHYSENISCIFNSMHTGVFNYFHHIPKLVNWHKLGMFAQANKWL